MARHSYSPKQVQEIFKWSKSTYFEKIKARVIPPPYKPDPAGRKVVHDGPEIDEHQRLRIAERDRQGEAA
jgi:hypothetical protein